MEILDHCDEETCSVWGTGLKMCSHCGDERYCSLDCQGKSWSKHKEIYSKPDVIDGVHFAKAGRIPRDKSVVKKINQYLPQFTDLLESTKYVEREVLAKKKFAIITIHWDFQKGKIYSDIEIQGNDFPIEYLKEVMQQLFPMQYGSFLAPFYNFDFSRYFLCKIQLHNAPKPPLGRENDSNWLDFFWTRLPKNYADKLKSLKSHK